MISFEEFTKKAQDALSKATSQEIVVKKVTKNNSDERTALTVNEEDAASVLLYLDEYYEDYKNEISTMDDALSEIVNFYQEAVEKANIKMPDIKKIMQDKNYIKEHVKAKIVSNINNSYLDDKIHTDIDNMNMAYIYYISVYEDEMGQGTITLRDDMLDSLDISQKELHDIAFNNTKDANKPVLLTMRSILKAMAYERLGDEEEARLSAPNLLTKDEIDINMNQEDMFILTNENKQDGAITMFYPDIMSQITDRLNTKNVFIIPSSIHEVLIVPVRDYDKQKDKLRDILLDVNQNSVGKNEVLSNNLYYYSSNNQSLEMIKPMYS